ncbi:MAG: PepSY domain-containing protein [Caulobacteraceae bacterium]|nr:PepSY domain-containing protein [Caulobacteraceae bacterium]
MNSSLYAAVWRWHFIAGLLVLPVLVMMAITGGAYLFQPELDHLAYHRLEDVPSARRRWRRRAWSSPRWRRPCRAASCCSRRRASWTGPCACSCGWRPARR